MAYISTDRTGKYLFSASYGGNKIAVSPIGPDGVVQAALQVMPTQPKCALHRGRSIERYVLHTSLGGDLVYQEKFDAKTGKLAPNDPPSVSVKAKAGARHLVFSPNKKFVYLVDELDGSIYVFPWMPSRHPEEGSQVATSLPRVLTASRGRRTSTSRRTTIPLRLRAHHQHARGIQRRSQDGHADVDRFLCDGKAAARLQHRSDGRYLFSVANYPSSMTSYADQGHRQAHQAEGISGRQEAELGSRS